LPTVRHQLPRGRFAELTAYQVAVLLDQDPPEPDDEDTWWSIVEAGADEPHLAHYPRSIKSMWLAHEPALLGVWLASNPGARPAAWWSYRAPEPQRRRLGGKGTPRPDVLAYRPRLACGIPVDWITGEDLHTWPGLMAEPYDPADPPLFEAQAAYLRRHGLFLQGERRRLRAADFEPEAVLLGPREPK
jgi:hypothetical protein